MKKITIDFLTPDENIIREFCALYHQLMPTHERVDPAYLYQCLSRPNRAPRSIDELANRTQWSGQKSYRLLLGAWADTKLVGFADVVFVPSMRLAFVASIATLPLAGLTGTVTQELFKHLDQLGSIIPWEWLVYELAHDGAQIKRALARQRLFRRSLRDLQRETFRLSVPYRRPHSTAVARNFNEFNATADLMIATLGPRRRVPGTLAKASVLNLVRSIYFDIYAEALAPDMNSYLYCGALEAQLKVLERKLPDQVALLGEFRIARKVRPAAPTPIKGHGTMTAAASDFFSAQMTYA